MSSSVIVYRRSQRYSGKSRKHVKITHRMGALLHYILTNIQFHDGHFVLDITDELQDYLDEFDINDVIYTYDKLGLNLDLYSPDLVNRAREKVLYKTRYNYNKYEKIIKKDN